MIKEITIQLIHAKDCPDCQEMRDAIYRAINDTQAETVCKVQELDSESDEAIDIAIENDIDDLPSCIIGDFVFCGKNGYSYEEFVEAIESIVNN